MDYFGLVIGFIILEFFGRQEFEKTSANEIIQRKKLISSVYSEKYENDKLLKSFENQSDTFWEYRNVARQLLNECEDYQAEQDLFSVSNGLIAFRNRVFASQLKFPVILSNWFQFLSFKDLEELKNLQRQLIQQRYLLLNDYEFLVFKVDLFKEKVIKLHQHSVQQGCIKTSTLDEYIELKRKIPRHFYNEVLNEIGYI